MNQVAFLKYENGGKRMLNNQSPLDLIWPNANCTLTPYEIFTSKEIFELEQEKIFRGPVWNYLGFEAEIPKHGDFITCWVGTTPIVVSRNEDKSISAFVNRCAHRGAQVVRDVRGSAKFHTCVYHQWMYNTEGDLESVSLHRGIKTKEGFKGGYPKDFDKRHHCLQKMRVDTHSGMIFGTFSEETIPLIDYLGPVVAERIKFITRDGDINIGGYHRHTIKCNWKMMAENSRDMYHAPQLHHVFQHFGVLTNEDTGSVETFDKGQVQITGYAKRTEKGDAISKSSVELKDPRITRWQDDRDGMTLSVSNVFPNGLLTIVNNNLSMRQLRPKGPDRLELFYTWFSYKDDDEEMTEMRRFQRNAFGPSGLVAAEDALVFEMIQASIQAGSVSDDQQALLMMGGTGTESTDYYATEASIRGFYKQYIDLMGFEVAKPKVAAE